MRLQVIAVAWLLAMLASFLAGWSWRGDRADAAEAARALEAGATQVQSLEKARAVEYRRNERLGEIGAVYEGKRFENESLPAVVAGAIRDGSVQLRDDLATCNTRLLSQAAVSALQRDEAAQLRAEVAGALVQVGADADAQLEACQAVVAADRR